MTVCHGNNFGDFKKKTESWMDDIKFNQRFKYIELDQVGYWFKVCTD